MSREISSTKIRGKILRSACRLFMEQGFRKTSVRQIAEDAGVSLGLIPYYFKSKDNLAIIFHIRIRERCLTYVNEKFDVDRDPHSYLAALIYLEFAVHMSAPIYKLYHDFLECGIYEKYLLTTGTEILERILKIEGKVIDHDQLLLYSVFVCGGLEKALVINKARGLFPTIPYEDIPEHIFRNSVGAFSSDKDAISRSLAAAKTFIKDFTSLQNQFTLDLILETD